eukprot:scaffold25377_cov53-Attheya_sp.AAC.7
MLDYWIDLSCDRVESNTCSIASNKDCDKRSSGTTISPQTLVEGSETDNLDISPDIFSFHTDEKDNLDISPDIFSFHTDEKDYHTTLLWTTNCYQMLEWCIANYIHYHVLQQSAGGTIQRLQATLSSDNDLRMRFLAALAQHQKSQELTRSEVLSQDQQEDRTTSDEVIHE